VSNFCSCSTAEQVNNLFKFNRPLVTISSSSSSVSCELRIDKRSASNCFANRLAVAWMMPSTTVGCSSQVNLPNRAHSSCLLLPGSLQMETHQLIR
jgi:hypothetical protein